MGVLPPPPALPACERCGKRAVQRIGGLYFCGRHGEEELRGGPCPLADCVRRGGHPLHMTATEYVWHEPILSAGSAVALEHAHFYTFGECRLGRASRQADELTASGCVEAVMQNRQGAYRLTPLGHAVADLAARRRIQVCADRIAAGGAEEPPERAEGSLL